MLQHLIYFLIGISLSMDTFSLSLSLGTTSPSKKNIIKLTIIVGFFHFIMPIIGSNIGILFSNQLINYSNYITAIVFIILAINMYINRNEEEINIIFNFLSILIIGFSVSIDSFSIGIALGITKKNIISSSIIFAICSSLFTYLGLNIGTKVTHNFNKKAIYFGITILIIIAIKSIILV